MKKYFFSFLLALSLLTFTVSPALADDEVRNLVLDLKAKGFTQTTFFDNLDSSNIIFAPNDKFQVQLKISNLGNRTQTQIVVKEALPSDVTTDSAPVFTIPQIAAGQDYIQNVTVTVKDKAAVNKALTSNSIRFTAKSEIGTESGDYTSFFTNNGTKGATSSATPIIPNTGSATVVLGSIAAALFAAVGLRLRRLARGY
jgi:uncharacterized membrane protein